MATRDQIVTANRATFDAWNAHDPDAVAAVFAEHAVIRDGPCRESACRLTRAYDE